MRCALTGGLAIDARLREHGRPGERQSLNDIDFVVEDFTSIPESLAGAFIQHHVHPDANQGRTLLQLVDQPRAIRIDLFCALGGSLSRASQLAHETGDLDVLSVEDLVARTTAFVCGRLRRGETIDVKHADASVDCADSASRRDWPPHGTTIANRCQDAEGRFARGRSVARDTSRADCGRGVSSTPVACRRCRAHGAFRPAPLETIVEILGYC